MASRPQMPTVEWISIKTLSLCSSTDARLCTANNSIQQNLLKNVPGYTGERMPPEFIEFIRKNGVPPGRGDS